MVKRKKYGLSLRDAVRFHGHLGPYLVLGILAGNLALKKIKAKKYFGLRVKVWGANQKPKSCLVDGLQLSTGATYGKGNIQKLKGKEIRIVFRNSHSNRKIKIFLHKKIIKKLGELKGYSDSRILARKLYKTNPLAIFELTP